MTNFLFFDADTGEHFFVQAATLDEAKVIAEENFDEPFFRGEFTDETAEWYGYDTY